MDLKEELQYLNSLLKKAKLSLDRAPKGELVISSSNGSIQYHKDRDYLSKKNINLVKQLAQKKYDRIVIKIIENQIRLLDEVDKHIDLKAIENIPGTLKPEIKELITPYAISDEEYAKQWKEKRYNSKEKDGTYITANGEHVRSKSEVMIADRLLLNNIPYRYEETVQLNANYRHMEYHPDFTVLNKQTRKEYFIEHFGKMDDFDYANKAMRKINNYAANGFIQGKNILFTFETSLYPLDMNTVDALIKTYLI